MKLTAEEFAAWRRYIHELCAVSLDDTKSYLVETRLAQLYKEVNAANWLDLMMIVRQRADLRTRVINNITTNETSFFRDGAPFELLQHKLLPDLIDRRTKAGLRPIPIRILSAACSTGQEVFTTCFVLKELLGSFSGYDIRILGVDISDAAISKASYAHYSRLELERGISQERLNRYFEPAGEYWKVRDELRSLATFCRTNLLEPLGAKQLFDIIFCRNVAIYFNETDKIRLFRNLKNSLASDGALLIGSTESITGLCPEFEPKRYLRSIFYQRKDT